MFNVVVVVLFLIALGLLWKTRERLEPAGNIMAPEGKDVQDGYRTYSPEQATRIWTSVPDSVRAFMMASYTDPQYASTRIELAKRDTAWFIAHFYKDVYNPATKPITPQDVDTWIKSQNMENYPEYRKMLISYFIDGAQLPETPVSAPRGSVDPSPQPLDPMTNPTGSAPQPVPNVSEPPSDVPPLQQPSRSLDVTAPTTITINVRP